MSAAAGLLLALLALGQGAHTRALAARAHAGQAQARVIALDVQGPVEDATALRATLQELTTRRGLALSFDERSPRAAEPWATLSVVLGAAADGGTAMILREGTEGRVRLHRVVPACASRQVAIETLATIAYTALETLALEENARERPAVRPRSAAPAPQERAEQPEPETTPRPSQADSAPAPPLPDVTTPPDDGAATKPDSDGLTLSARASVPALAEGAASSPVRLSLASFAGYQAGNLFTGARRAGGDAWGVGLAAAVAVPRWPLQPALGLGLGAWYGTSRVPGTSDGVPRAAPGARWQGQAEVRLTLLRLGRFSAALGPWLTVARATDDFGFAPMGTRGPGPSQGPGDPGPAPNGDGAPSSVTHTDVSAGLAVRFEASLGGPFALYGALAGATPLTARPGPGGNRQAGGTPNDTGEAALDAGTRWTLSALAGLSVDLTGQRSTF